MLFLHDLADPADQGIEAGRPANVVSDVDYGRGGPHRDRTQRVRLPVDPAGRHAPVRPKV
jgi:hypothetical protein